MVKRNVEISDMFPDVPAKNLRNAVRDGNVVRVTNDDQSITEHMVPEKHRNEELSPLAGIERDENGQPVPEAFRQVTDVVPTQADGTLDPERHSTAIPEPNDETADPVDRGGRAGGTVTDSRQGGRG